jgi:hypothetical protein
MFAAETARVMAFLTASEGVVDVQTSTTFFLMDDFQTISKLVFVSDACEFVCFI